MNDGARGHVICERRAGRPNPDRLSSASSAKAVVWRSSRPSHIAGCYVLGCARCTLQSASCLSCPKCVRSYHWRDIEFCKTDQMSKGNASAILLLFFSSLLFRAHPYPKEPQRCPPHRYHYRHHHGPHAPLLTLWAIHSCALGFVVTDAVGKPNPPAAARCGNITCLHA